MGVPTLASTELSSLTANPQAARETLQALEALGRSREHSRSVGSLTFGCVLSSVFVGPRSGPYSNVLLGNVADVASGKNDSCLATASGGGCWLCNPDGPFFGPPWRWWFLHWSCPSWDPVVAIVGTCESCSF